MGIYLIVKEQFGYGNVCKTNLILGFVFPPAVTPQPVGRFFFYDLFQVLNM
jgi:hypothetical protein